MKNTTFASLTENVIRSGWSTAKKVQTRLAELDFWAWDWSVAADRKLHQKLNETIEVEGDEEDYVDNEPEYEVEKIVRKATSKEVEKQLGEKNTGTIMYVVKWKGYDSSANTFEPEEHLLCNKLLTSFWKTGGKKNKVELDRVTKLQEAALATKAHEAGEKARRSQTLSSEMESPLGANSTDAHAVTAACQVDRPERSACSATYDVAHSVLSRATCLVFDTETSNLNGSVLDLGWVLADSVGVELAHFQQLWKLPRGERIHSEAFAAHKISLDRLRREGVDPKLEVAEFFALVAAALAMGVIIVAHHASFDVRALNNTVYRHRLKLPPLSSAQMLCTMDA